MSTVFVVIAYILIVVLAVAVIRLLFAAASQSKAQADLKATQDAHARRIEQLSSAINNIQAGLLNLSTGAQALLTAADQESEFAPVKENPPLTATPTSPTISEDPSTPAAIETMIAQREPFSKMMMEEQVHHQRRHGRVDAGGDNANKLKALADALTRLKRITSS